MKHLSLILLMMAVSCGKSSNDKQNEPETPDTAIQDTVIGEQPAAADAVVVKDESQPAAEKPSNSFKLDASSSTAAVYFKLENGALVGTSSDQGWHFNVKRTQFQTNSGTSGSAQIGVYDTGATDYASVSSCAAGTLTFDEMLPASGAPGSQPYSGNAKLNAWYDYDAVTHVVSSKKTVYLVSDGASCFKFQILSYEGGIYQVQAEGLTIPVIDPSQAIDASSTTNLVYLKTADGKLSSSAVDAAWEFNVKRTIFQTNSGTSGSGLFGVYNTDVTDYASVTSCAAPGFTKDEMLPAGSGNAVLNAWYNYDAVTHAISSKKLVYLISNGTTCTKFQILSYAAGVYKVLTDSVPIPAPVVSEQSLDASATTTTLYLKLADGKLAATTADDTAWLFNVKRTQFQTNSGTSGTGMAGVYDTNSTDFSALTSCSGLSFTADAMLPASGAPGSQPYSGNAVLNAWYDYDFATHLITSKQHVYAISTGTQCLKFQILSYASGVYNVKVSLL